MPRRLCLLVADRYTHSILRFDAEDDTFIDEFVSALGGTRFSHVGRGWAPGRHLRPTQWDLFSSSATKNYGSPALSWNQRSLCRGIRAADGA